MAEEISATVGALAVSFVARARGADGVLALLQSVGTERVQHLLAHPDLWVAYDEVMAMIRAAAELCEDDDIGTRLGEEAARVLFDQGRVQSFRERPFAEVIEVLVGLLDEGSSLRRMRIVRTAEMEAVIESVPTSSAVAEDRFLCRFGAALLSAIPAYLGRTGVAHEVACVTRGAPACRFEVRWQPPLGAGEPATPLGESILGGPAWPRDLDDLAPDGDERRRLARILEQVVDALPLPQHVSAVHAVLESRSGEVLARFDRGTDASPAGATYAARIDGGPGLCGAVTIEFSGRGLPGVDQLLVESCAQEIGRVLAAASALGELHERARRDPLTGLANRAQLEELGGAVGEGAAVVFVDLDGFKAVNDTHGHLAGDALLAQVGARLRDAMRAADVLARYGGDEFVALVPATQSAQDAAVVAEKLHAVFAEPFDLAEVTPSLVVRLGASVGVARSPDDGVTLSELVAAADERMYRAKRNAR